MNTFADASNLSGALQQARASSDELEAVRQFRRDALANGYKLVRVLTLGKAPVAKGWTEGESAESLLNVTPQAANTGLLTAGLRVVDVDVDDETTAAAIVSLAEQYLPPGALIRRRGGPRHAMLYRPAEGQPGKRQIGEKGRSVEVHGVGQQIVVDGIHKTGAQYTWDDDRSPATVPLDQLPPVTEENISVFLDACAVVLGSATTPDGRSRYMINPALFPPRPARNDNIPNACAAGVEQFRWFEGLPDAEKRSLVKTCLDAIDNLASDPRDRWLRTLFAVADADRQGCPDARDLALEWSRRGAGWTSEADFDQAWNSFKPGGITVGSLIHEARAAGADLSTWEHLKIGLGGGESQVPSVPLLPPHTRKPLVGGNYTATEALELLNSHYFVGKSDQQTGIFRIKEDGYPVFVPPDQFKLDVANIFVRPGNGSCKPISGEKFWRESPHRHQRTIVFKPGGEVEGDEFNLWRGFTVEPRRGWQKQRRLMRHIWRIICRRDKSKFKYLIRWLAFLVQHPDKAPGTIIVLKSRKEGTGKSTLGTVLLKIFRPENGALIDDKDRLLGRFNDWLEPICFLLAEEVLWPGDHKATDKLKSLITADTLQLERKHGGVWPARNRLHCIMTSNHEHAVAAGVGNRRYVVFEVSEERACDKTWFGPLYADLDAGGVNEFLDFLLRIRLGDWHPREIIKTKEAIEQQRMSADSISQWAQACIEADEIVGAQGLYGLNELGTRIAKNTLREAYAGFCKQQGMRAVNVDTFSKACTKMFGSGQKCRAAPGSNKRPWAYDVPDRDTWQERVDEHLGIKK